MNVPIYLMQIFQSRFIFLIHVFMDSVIGDSMNHPILIDNMHDVSYSDDTKSI